MRRQQSVPAPSRPWTPEEQDAYALALELAGLRPMTVTETMPLGIALEPGETAHRLVGLWLSIRVDGVWTVPEPCQVVITDRRLLVRLLSGDLVSMWWGAVVGFWPDLTAGYVVIDFGDGMARALRGPAIGCVAVAGMIRLYGVDALIGRPQ